MIKLGGNFSANNVPSWLIKGEASHDPAIMHGGQFTLHRHQTSKRFNPFALMTALVLLLSFQAPALAKGAAEHDAATSAVATHHVSLLLGGTHVDEVGETAFTAGVDYEYRVNHLIGMGFVAERAFGEINATTLLAVADIHIRKGLALQVGPGVEFIDGSQYAVARIGALYEFEIGHHYTIAPQFHYDITEHDDSIVFGLALGRHF